MLRGWWSALSLGNPWLSYSFLVIYAAERTQESSRLWDVVPKVFVRLQFILDLPGSTYVWIFSSKPSQPFASVGFASSDSISCGSKTAFPHSQPRIPKGASKILFSIHRCSTAQMGRSDCQVKILRRLSTAQGAAALPPHSVPGPTV